MKTLIALAALGFAAWGTQAQGQFTFANKNLNTTPPILAKLTKWDGVTAVEGTACWAQAYIKLASDPDSSYAAVGAAVNFRTGVNAGYIVPVVITTPYPGGTPVTVQMRAWEATGGTSFEAAVKAGKLYYWSNGVNLTVTVAPATPPDMIGLAVIYLIPEPSSLALALLGAAVLWGRRRR